MNLIVQDILKGNLALCRSKGCKVESFQSLRSLQKVYRFVHPSQSVCKLAWPGFDSTIKYFLDHDSDTHSQKCQWLPESMPATTMFKVALI